MKICLHSTYKTQCYFDLSVRGGRHLEISTWQDYRTSMEARASNIKAWKHESILLYFYSTYITQCHIDSTSVAYKQSEEEDI